MLNIRQRIFIVLSVIILVVLAIAMILLVSYRKKTAITPNSQQPAASGENIIPSIGQQPASIPSGAVSKQLTTEEMEKNAAKQTAKIFLERYNSYSTDNAFQNIRDVENLVSDNLWSKLSAQIKTGKTSENFVGVSAKAISSEIKQWEKNKAIIEVGISKEEKREGKTAVIYENYSVEAIKTDSGWIINAFSKMEL